jgi:hypothetical protein
VMVKKFRNSRSAHTLRHVNRQITRHMKRQNGDKLWECLPVVSTDRSTGVELKVIKCADNDSTRTQFRHGYSSTFVSSNRRKCRYGQRYCMDTHHLSTSTLKWQPIIHLAFRCTCRGQMPPNGQIVSLATSTSSTP